MKKLIIAVLVVATLITSITVIEADGKDVEKIKQIKSLVTLIVANPTANIEEHSEYNWKTYNITTDGTKYTHNDVAFKRIHVFYCDIGNDGWGLHDRVSYTWLRDKKKVAYKDEHSNSTRLV